MIHWVLKVEGILKHGPDRRCPAAIPETCQGELEEPSSLHNESWGLEVRPPGKCTRPHTGDPRRTDRQTRSTDSHVIWSRSGNTPPWITYSKLPAPVSSLKYSEVVNQKTTAKGVLQVQANYPSAYQPPNLQRVRTGHGEGGLLSAPPALSQAPRSHCTSKPEPILDHCRKSKFLVRRVLLRQQQSLHPVPGSPGTHVSVDRDN